MNKQKNCCSFFQKFCRKLCNKASTETVKPEISNSLGQAKIAVIQKTEIEEKKPIVKIAAVYKSNIVPGSAKMPIYNSAVGFVTTTDKKSIEIFKGTEENAKEIEGKKKENNVLFYDQSVSTENINKEVLIQNLDDAYNMIHELGDATQINLSEENLGEKEKFTKVMRGIDFKKILSDEN